MRLSKLMLAVAALTIGTSTFAAPAASRIAVASGASASKGNLGLTMGSLCIAGGGVMTEFTSGGNISTYVCSTVALTSGAGGTYVTTPDANFRNFNGTSYAELRLNVAGGSFTAVQTLDGSYVDNYLDPATNTTPAVIPAGATLVGGLMDVEPTAFPATVLGSLAIPAVTAAGVAQAFGVGASNLLYTAMFNDQKSAGTPTVDKPIPSTCLVTDTGNPTCVPTISKGQMAAIMDGNTFNSAKLLGAQFLAPSLAANTELRYVRRVNTSGTQASAQNYFLGLPCSTGPRTVIPEPTTDQEAGGLLDRKFTNLRVLAAPGTSDVRTELNSTTNYSIGVMSGENNQASQNWKWLRIQGAPMGENSTPATAGVTNRAGVLNGSYDFFFESVYVTNSAPGAAFWGTVAAAMSALAAPVGLFNSTELAGYNKNGSACVANSKGN